MRRKNACATSSWRPWRAMASLSAVPHDPERPSESVLQEAHDAVARRSEGHGAGSLAGDHNNRHTYRPEQPLTAWVHTIARYELIDLLRSRSRRELLNGCRLAKTEQHFGAVLFKDSEESRLKKTSLPCREALSRLRKIVATGE